MDWRRAMPLTGLVGTEGLEAGASEVYAPTIQSSTTFLRPVRDGHVEAVARPLNVGRTVIVVETELVDATAAPSRTRSSRRRPPLADMSRDCP